MNGATIANFLFMDPVASLCFEGFAMQDSAKLPGDPHMHHLHHPKLYILNTDTKQGKGKHWCALFVDFKTVDFFDPYGFGPDFYGFLHLLNPLRKKINYSEKNVQGVFSHACGYHCLFFSYYRCRGYLPDSILEFYNDVDVNQNDKMVVKFVRQFGSKYKPCL